MMIKRLGTLQQKCTTTPHHVETEECSRIVCRNSDDKRCVVDWLGLTEAIIRSSVGSFMLLQRYSTVHLY